MTTVVKGKIIRSDMFIYDGISETVSRRDSTGGTIISLPIGDAVDVLGAYGNMEAYNRQTIERCTTAIGTKTRTLVFRPGTWTIDANTTIASNFTCLVLAGAVFSVDAGVTLTFSGPVIRHAQTWTSGSGTVTESGTRYFSGAFNFVGTTQFVGTTTFDGTTTVGTNTDARQLRTNGPAVSDRGLYFQTAGVLRFTQTIDTGPETGSNAGSNYRLVRYDDSGIVLGTVMRVQRSTGAVEAGASPTGGLLGTDIWNFKATPRVNNVVVLTDAAAVTINGDWTFDQGFIKWQDVDGEILHQFGA